MWSCFEACLGNNVFRKEHEEDFRGCLNLISLRGGRLCQKCGTHGTSGHGRKIYWKLCTFMWESHEMNVARAYVLCKEHSDTSFTPVENAMNLGSVGVLDKIYEECKYPCMLEF